MKEKSKVENLKHMFCYSFFLNEDPLSNKPLLIDPSKSNRYVAVPFKVNPPVNKVKSLIESFKSKFL